MESDLQSFILYALNNIFRKGPNQDISRLLLINPTTTKVKERLIIKLPHRSPMGAFHIVSEDLQLWAGIDGCCIREQQALIGLHSVGLLRVLVDYNSPAKDTA